MLLKQRHRSAKSESLEPDNLCFYFLMCFIDGCIQTEAVRTLESEGYHFRPYSAPSSCNEKKKAFMKATLFFNHI